MKACDVSLKEFGSSPNKATEFIKNSLDDYQSLPNEKNWWEGLFSAASNGIGFHVREDLATAEAWAEVIDLLTDRLMDTPIYHNARIHRIHASIALLHFHGVDTSRRFRNPCWWIMEFDARYSDWFIEMENLLVKHIHSDRSEFCDTYLADELSQLVIMAKYPMDTACKHKISRWVDLWERQRT